MTIAEIFKSAASTSHVEVMMKHGRSATFFIKSLELDAVTLVTQAGFYRRVNLDRIIAAKFV